MLTKTSLPFIVTLGIVSTLVIVVLYYLILKKRPKKSDVNNVKLLRPNLLPRPNVAVVRYRPHTNKSKSKTKTLLKTESKKKMAGNAPVDKKKNTKAEPSVNDEPLETAGSAQSLKRRSFEECKDISNSSPCKRQSPGKSMASSDFGHPVYKSISSRNGEINRMTHQQLTSTLKQLNLDSCGYPDILRRRLKLHYSQTSLDKAGLDLHKTTQNYDYLCVIDFEATCERQNPTDYLHEIIEFPIVLVNTKTRQVEDTFMMFCKPLLNPRLSEFCTSLTNITQTQVEHADTFPIVLERVNQWIKDKDLGSKYKFAIVADGPWDMNMFLRVQCKLSKVKFPSYATKWINLSKSFSNYYKTSRVKLELMLRNLGMKFEGRPHRGIDDAHNIARIAVKLMEDGCTLVINDALT